MPNGDGWRVPSQIWFFSETFLSLLKLDAIFVTLALGFDRSVALVDFQWTITNLFFPFFDLSRTKDIRSMTSAHLVIEA